METTHLYLLACSWNVSSNLVAQSRLSSASRSRRRSEKASPFRTSTGLRIAVGCQSHTLFAQRGSVFIYLSVIRIAAQTGNVNETVCFCRAIQKSPVSAKHLLLTPPRCAPRRTSVGALAARSAARAPTEVRRGAQRGGW